ncbi:MAG: glycosyltransferase [bacterium]
MDLSIIIPAYNEEKNIGILIDEIKKVVSKLNISYEIIVVDNYSQDKTPEIVNQSGALLVNQKDPGYGGALKEGFKVACGEYFLTMDADLSHTPSFIVDLYENRNKAEIIIGSRYIENGKSETFLIRKISSIFLNKIFAWVLKLPFKDLSSGFRLYNKKIFKTFQIKSRDFDVLEEILIFSYCNNFKIIEIPIHYKPRAYGKTHAKLIQFLISYTKTLNRMKKLRNTHL